MALPPSGPSRGRGGARVVVYDRLLPAVPGSVGCMRRALIDTLESLELAVGRLDDVALVASEGATNAVLHAYPAGSPGPVRVRADVLARDLVISVSDWGAGMRPRPDSPGMGVGMPLMRQMCDDFAVRSTTPASGTQLAATFRGATRGLRPSVDESHAISPDDAPAVLRDYVRALLDDPAAPPMGSVAAVAQARRALGRVLTPRRS